MDASVPPLVDTEARERIAELFGRVAAHERHCDERHHNLREFMARMERNTDQIHIRLGAIWRWILGVLGLLIVTLLGLIGNVISSLTTMGT